MKTKTIMIMVNEEFKERVKKAAIADNKTLTGYINDLILADLNKRDGKHEPNKD